MISGDADVVAPNGINVKQQYNKSFLIVITGGYRKYFENCCAIYSAATADGGGEKIRSIVEVKIERENRTGLERGSAEASLLSPVGDFRNGGLGGDATFTRNQEEHRRKSVVSAISGWFLIGNEFGGAC